MDSFKDFFVDLRHSSLRELILMRCELEDVMRDLGYDFDYIFNNYKTEFVEKNRDSYSKDRPLLLGYNSLAYAISQCYLFMQQQIPESPEIPHDPAKVVKIIEEASRELN